MTVMGLLVRITAVFCHLAINTAYSQLLYEYTSIDYCQPPTSYWWKCRSSYFGCRSGKKYHCAKDYDSPEVFKEGCAIEKFCQKEHSSILVSLGPFQGHRDFYCLFVDNIPKDFQQTHFEQSREEPFLSFIKDGRQVTEPEVYCRTCADKDRYNNKQNTSSAEYSECPDKKWNICTEEEHKKLCKPEDSTKERFCRCDSRNGFYPMNDNSIQKCSYKNYDCGHYKAYKKCGAEEELLLNYTCAAKCDEGFARLNEDNDDCDQLSSVTTRTVPILSTSQTMNYGTTAVPSTKTPETECSEECAKYQICVRGKCVCPEVCAAVYDPVCGYHEESNTFDTFSSKCQLRRHYCKQRKFVLYANGQCKKEKEKEKDHPKLSPTIVTCAMVCVVFMVCVTVGLVYAYKYARKKRYSQNKHKTERWCFSEDNNQDNPEQIDEKRLTDVKIEAESKLLLGNEDSSSNTIPIPVLRYRLMDTDNDEKVQSSQEKHRSEQVKQKGEQDPLLDSKCEFKNTIPVDEHLENDQEQTGTIVQPGATDNKDLKTQTEQSLAEYSRKSEKRRSVEGIPQQLRYRSSPDSCIQSDSHVDYQNKTAKTDTDVQSSSLAIPSTSLNQKKKIHSTDNQLSNSQDEFQEQHSFRRGPSFEPPEEVSEEVGTACS